MSNPAQALQCYLEAVVDLDWLTVDHLRDTRRKFHRGELDGFNARFSPKPVDLRKMLERVHFLKVAEVLKMEMPELMAKPFTMLGDGERQKIRELRELLLHGAPYGYCRHLSANQCVKTGSKDVH